MTQGNKGEGEWNVLVRLHKCSNHVVVVQKQEIQQTGKVEVEFL